MVTLYSINGQPWSLQSQLMSLPKSVNVAEAKARLPELIERAARGEEIIIARNGEPRARLVPLPPRKARVPGKGAGRWTVVGDFNEPLPDEVLADFEERPA
jgi:prevent-host-death family protein